MFNVFYRSSSRKQQTAVNRTVDRSKPQIYSKDTINEDTSWSQFSVKIFSGAPELNLICQDPLTETEL